MKRKSSKKLKLDKIKIASLTPTKPGIDTLGVSFQVCTNDISQTAPICSVDSCRF